MIKETVVADALIRMQAESDRLLKDSQRAIQHKAFQAAESFTSQARGVNDCLGILIEEYNKAEVHYGD